MGISARDALATPSILGFGASTFAAGVIPAAIPIAALAGTLISDPGQIRHAGDRHATVAETAGKAKDDTDAIVKPADGFSTPAARQAYDTRMGQYTKALGDTKDQHSTLDTMMKIAGDVWIALGAASLAVGTALALQAAGVISVSWLPGANAAAFAEANGFAGAMNVVLRGIVTGLRGIITKIITMLKGIKDLSLKRKLLLGGLAVGGVMGHSYIGNAVSSIVPVTKPSWPTNAPA
ncbi:hypothetical protein [Actinoallomurus sp. CA-142502]|uniref:hypothetical protein n=1 Tax=Actinoallomurus sp. CA-142502 TaxID=3239885 RepID=UPI003D8FF63D